MNQILDFGDGNGNNNNNEKPKKPIKEKKNNKNEYNNFGGESSFNSGNNYGGNSNYNSSKAPMSDKVVKVFAGLMIILAIALIASGAMSLMKNKKDSTAKNTNTTAEPQIQAEILAELDETTGKVKMTINSQIVISKMIYSWDKEHDNVVSGEKQTSIEEEVVAPHGEHVLHVQVIDEQNNKTTKEFTFNSETGIDTTQPDITLEITEDKKLSVTAIDDTSIAYVTYTWNEGEAVTMTPEEDLKEYSFEIDIPKGKNTIVVVAVDGSESSNAKTTSKVLEGVTKPELKDCVLVDSVGSAVQVTFTHENGIQKIYYTLNGQPYQWEVAEGEEAPKELSFTQNSVEGHNEMMITVTSVDGTTTEFNPVWDYNVASTTESTDRSSSEESESTDNTGDTSEESLNN